MATQFDYTKSPCAIDRLKQEIQQSAIVTALDHLNLFGAALSIFFKADLSDDDVAILDALVEAHGGTPLPINEIQNVAVTSQPPLTVASTPAFGSKTITVAGVTKKLYARNIGFQHPMDEGANTIDYTATLPWAKLLGAEIVNCEALDTVDFKVYDTAQGSFSGVPNAMLNQFGFSVNLPKDFYVRLANFDADVYAGLIIRLTYTSVSAKTVGFNLIFNEVKS